MQWPPTPKPGTDREEAVRLGRCRAGDFHRVEVQDPACVGELLGQGEDDGALDVLIQLGGLGRLRRADRVNRVGDLAEYAHGLGQVQRWEGAGPATRGVIRWWCSGTPGSIRSGLNATNTSVPTFSPRRSSGSVSSSLVVPTWVVNVRIRVCPGRAQVAGLAQAALSGPRSGSLPSVTGVGTQMITASASRMSSMRVDISNVPSARASASVALSASFRSAFPESITSSRSRLMSIPMTCWHRP